DLARGTALSGLLRPGALGGRTQVRLGLGAAAHAADPGGPGPDHHSGGPAADLLLRQVGTEPRRHHADLAAPPPRGQYRRRLRRSWSGAQGRGEASPAPAGGSGYGAAVAAPA